MFNNQIKTFIQVADSRSFSKASEKLLVSTVAVMKKINALEALVGVKLLDRTNQGVTLTAAGQSFYRDAQEMMKLQDVSVLRARDAAGAERHIIRIGSSQLHPHSAIAGKLAALDWGRIPFYVRVVPFLDSGIESGLGPRLLGREFDCFAGPYSLSGWEESCTVRHLRDMAWRVALPRGHRLAARERISPADLYGETLLLHARGAVSGFDELRGQLEANHPEIKLSDLPFYSAEAFNLAVQKGYALLSLDIWDGVHPSLVSLPADFEGGLPLGVICGKSPSAELLEFLEYLS